MRHCAAISVSLFVLLLAAVWFLRPRPLSTDPRWVVIGAGPVRIGPESPREWADEDSRPVEGPRFERSFTTAASGEARLLSIRQEGVKRSWGVFLNDRKLGTLVPDETALEHLIEIPGGALRDGENRLRIEPAKEPDDIVIGPVALIEAARGDWLAGGTVSIVVTDGGDGRALPCRLSYNHLCNTITMFD